MSGNTWMGIAYVDQRTEKEINKEKYEQARYNTTKGILSNFYEKVTKLYLSTQKYVHCEIAFPTFSTNKTGECEAYGVFSNEGVFVRMRTFSNPAYHCLFLAITQDELVEARTFCLRQIGKKFDGDGMRWSPIWPTPTKEDSWYCVSFTIAVLQSIGILQHYSPTSLDTDELISIMKQHSRTIEGILPYKLQNNVKTSHLFANHS